MCKEGDSHHGYFVHNSSRNTVFMSAGSSLKASAARKEGVLTLGGSIREKTAVTLDSKDEVSCSFGEVIPVLHTYM